MKICFFTENYYKGGLDTFLINLINAWPDVNDELTLVCNGTHTGLETIIEKTSRPLEIKKYYRLFTSNIAQGHCKLSWARSFPVRVVFGLARRFLQYPILFPWYIFSLTIFFRYSDYDRLMVVNGGYPASLIGRSAVIAWALSGKRPLAIMNFHSLATSSPRSIKILDDIIDKLVIRFSAHVIGVSNACLESLSKRDVFLTCSKLSYIYNGIEDPNRFIKADSVESQAKPISQYCLMLATYHEYKGHFFLLEAFKNVLENFPDVRLAIYGHGFPHEKKQVADEVVRLNLQNNVTLGDFIPDTSLLLAGASVLVVPSQAYESFGLTIVEAMAFGVPVVVTNVGGMPEVLAGSGAGFVCSKDDSMEFASAIKDILGNKMLASELGKNGRLAFEKVFLASSMATKYYHLLKNQEY
jgi:glycosyltransferase involved in cell wall biosynthesis